MTAESSSSSKVLWLRGTPMHWLHVVLEGATPLSSVGLRVEGEHPQMPPPPTCPIWFDGDVVHVVLNPHASLHAIVFSVVQAYAIAYALGRVGGFPDTLDEDQIFDTALYEIYFLLSRHDERLAAAYKAHAVPEIARWTRASRKERQQIHKAN